MQGKTQDSSSNAWQWWILGVVGLAQLMVVLDATIVNIALPSAQQDLGFADDARQWVVTAYALAFGGLLLLGGRLGDLLGRKRVFIVGLLGFAGASAIAGLADSFGVLIIARALQGVFGALLAPAALSLLTSTFRGSPERGKAFGVYGAISGGGAAVGLLLGGILTEYLSWRWTMFVNIGFAIPAALGAVALLRGEEERTKTRIDIPGTLVGTLGLVGVVYGFSSAEMSGWGAAQTMASLAAGVVLLAAFGSIERRVERPLLPLRVVSDRTRACSYVAMLAAGAGMFGVFLFLTYYLQDTLGFSPLATGLAFLPMVATLAASSTFVSSKVLPRTGPRPLVPVGMALATVAMIYLTMVSVDSSYVTAVLPALLVFGVGFGLIMAPAMASATNGVLRSDTSVASALVNTCQQVGGSIGTALLSTISASAESAYLSSHGRGAATAAQAAVHGYTTAFWVSAAIFTFGLIATAMLLESGVTEMSPDAEPVVAH